MSVYGVVETEMSDVDRLQQAIEMAELGDKVETIRYGEGDGVYRKWSYLSHTGGQVRGRDASIVIHGGLDTQHKLCGDTAFVLLEDGSIRAELDLAHGDAEVNWKKIQGFYAFIGAQQRAERAGLALSYEVQEDGTITGQVRHPQGAVRAAPSRTAGRPGTVARPTPVRR